MDLRGYLRAIRLNWWIVVLCVLLGGFGGVASVYRATPVYAGHVTFFVASSGSGTSTSVSGDLTASEDLAVSYARLLGSDRLAALIATAEPSLGLNAGQISGRISGVAELNTVLLNAEVQDTSRARLKVLTRAVGVQFPRMVEQLNNTSSRVAINVVSGPTVGAAPVSPRTQLEVGLGVLVGLILGLVLAVGRYLLDTSVRSTDVIAELISHPSLGSVPFDSQAKRAPLVNADQVHSVRAEAFRQVRTNLQFIDAAHPVGAFIVTSAVQGEGKTTTACNLALVFAETGLSVLLVEADLRRPRTSEYLGLERAVGLSNVLANQVDLADVIQRWGDTSLFVLPSGALPPNPSELLGSEHMSELLVALREQYDLVIIDTPPLLPVTDAAVVATQVDGVVLVARFGKTRRAQLRTAAQTLESVNSRLLGVVLNMTRRDRNSRYGYSSYPDDSDGAIDGALDASAKQNGSNPDAAVASWRPTSTGALRADDHAQSSRWAHMPPPPDPSVNGRPPIATLRRSRRSTVRRRLPVELTQASKAAHRRV